MSINTYTNIQAFDRKFYQELSDRVAGYHAEMYDNIISQFPVHQCNFDVDEYKKPMFDQSEGVEGGEPSANRPTMATEKRYKIYRLQNVNAYLSWGAKEIRELGPKIIDQNNEQLMEWARNASLSVMKGVFSKGYKINTTTANNPHIGDGVKLNLGLIDQAVHNGVVEDLNGTDSALDAAGDVYAALTKMLNSIPFRYAQGRQVNFLFDSEFYAKANSSLFTNDSGVTEWDQWLKKFKENKAPRQIGNIYFSDELALNLKGLLGGTVDASSVTDTDADTIGTNSRILCWVNDPLFSERAYSRGFGKAGPDAQNIVNQIDQAWTVKLAGCLHRPDTMQYSEQISW